MIRAEKIADYLEQFKNDLPSIYPWSPKLDSLFDMKFLTDQEVSDLRNNELLNDNVPSNYLREIQLKKILNSYLTHFNNEGNNDMITKISNWIVQDWGGINSKNDNSKLISDVLSKQSEMYFERIASSSKIGAFMFPEDLIIYDSRVAYTLNWILLSSGEEKDFFPIPEGRNSKMMAFDMNVLIRLQLRDKYKPTVENTINNKLMISNFDKKIYYSKNKAYQILNNLIKDVHLLLWGNDHPKELYYTEMLLFSIADNQVYEDIISKVEFNIRK